MRLVIALGVAVGATVAAAYAHPGEHRMMVHHDGMELNIDANHDGWITRAEASGAADQMFDRLDSNHDGRLTPVDHGPMGADFDVRIGDPGETPEPDESNCSRSVEHTRHGDRVTVICNDDNNSPSGDHLAPRAESGDQHVERQVIIRRSSGETPAEAPLPPRPPHPPMFAMLLANPSEADRNNDGALSREEFRDQQLRFFDASDANRDGRIRFEPPPEPPTPPAPPVAPVAPTPPPPAPR